MTLSDGTEIKANTILSNATPKVTYLDLLPKVCANFTILFGQ